MNAFTSTAATVVLAHNLSGIIPRSSSSSSLIKLLLAIEAQQVYANLCD